MSLPPHPKANPDKSVKHRGSAMKEPVEHTEEVYYAMGPPHAESAPGESGGSSGLKGLQNRVHYQQTAPLKWMQQDPLQAHGWSQEAHLSTWEQNFGTYMGGVNNVRAQMALSKVSHDGGALQMAGEKQPPDPAEAYMEAAQAHAQVRGLEWEQHAAATVHQVQHQAFQQGQKGVDVQGQPHPPSHTMSGSMLQPFQLAFGPTKAQAPSGYHPAFQGSKGMPAMGYTEQHKTQHQLLQQMQQHQIQQQHLQQQQQQLHHQQQKTQHHPHHQQQQQQQQHLQHHHQMQQHQLQQQQLHQMQQQYRQHHLKEQRQQGYQLELQQHPQQPQHVQQKAPQLHLQKKEQQTTNFPSYHPSEISLPSANQSPPIGPTQSEDTQGKPQEAGNQPNNQLVMPDLSPQNETSDPIGQSDAPQVFPRRSRRLSRDGLSPSGGPTTTPWTQNGVVMSGERMKAGETQVPSGGVIQSTQRRRRASKEINLETLAQKASEMESLPSKIAKQDDGTPDRRTGMGPLVIPVSVPVRPGQTDQAGPHAMCQQETIPHQPERKPSVIVARRRSLRNSLSESLSQDGESDASHDEEGKSAKTKRRPRPEPLFIPLPKPPTFIAPSVYPSITTYHSHLRSPVRLLDNPLYLPPYTPPPILSPVREGSGLYFSTFLSSIAACNQSLPPPPPPKSAQRSLLRSTSSLELTPPVLPLITDATPVSFEPRINIGLQYQAVVPELSEQPSSQFDQHKADVVWLPLEDSELKHADQNAVDDLTNLACSSVVHGGGTNQELALHCLHECSGNVLDTLTLLLLKEPIFPKDHHLAEYHYSGSDCWTAAEKCYFNKGISAYRKDFFMVQKLVQTKTVAQCVEFYYTYKKQVKIGRSGTLTYGPSDSPVEKTTEAVVEIKSSQQSKLCHGESEDKKGSDQSQDYIQTMNPQTLKFTNNGGRVLVIPDQSTMNKETIPLSTFTSAPRKPRPDSAEKKRKPPPKPPLDPEGIFPCKKCSRVFYKVKSRSAHMKSHSEQEKKAAALRLREEEEERAAALAAEVLARKAAEGVRNGDSNRGCSEPTEQEGSSQESSEGEEDDEDEDWH